MTTPGPKNTPHDPERANVTQLVHLVGQGDSQAAERLLPLVYDELRRLARARLAADAPGQTLQPTALVHEAYLRLIGPDAANAPSWNGRGHFFGAAALAMRRILVERARAHARVKRGGDGEHRARRVPLADDQAVEESDPAALLAIDETLERLEAYDPLKARIVMLRFFAGLTLEETAAALSLTVSEAKTHWSYARAWMHRELSKGER